MPLFQLFPRSRWIFPLTHRLDARAHVTFNAVAMTILQGADTTYSKLIDAHVFSVCQGWR